MKLRFFDYVAATFYGALACWFVIGFFHGDPKLHNVELVSSYFTRAIHLAIYLNVGLVIAAVPYVYSLVRAGQFTVRKIAFPLFAMLLGLLVVYPPLSYVYERTLMTRSRIHPFIQLFPETPPPELTRRRKDEKLIVCMGGSTTAWGAEGRQWPAALEENLRNAGENVHVLKQAQPWFTTMHTLYNYQSNVRPLRPDIIIVMHAINDLTMNADHSYFSSGEFRSDYGHNLGPFARLSRTKPLPELIVDVARRSWHYPTRKPIDTDQFPGLPTFRRNLRGVATMAREDGTLVVFMTQGSLYKKKMTEDEKQRLYIPNSNAVGSDSYWTVETALNGMQRYNATTKELATELGIRLIDLEPLLPKDLSHFNDDCHYRRPAIDLIAEEVTTEISTLLDDQIDNTNKYPKTSSVAP